MNNSLYFTIISFIYCIYLIIVFFSKETINTIENKIFKLTLVSSFFICFLEILQLFIYLLFGNSFQLEVAGKLFLSADAIWVTLFLLYTLYISAEDIEKKDSKKFLKNSSIFLSIYTFLFIILVWICPINFYFEEVTHKFLYSFGYSVDMLYVLCGIYVTISILTLFFNIKNLISKKYIPLLVYLLFGFAVLIIQKIFPDILLITSVQVFVTYLMYFTIENPDVKMLEKVELARDAAEKANRAKSDFLSSMSHEIRTPLNAIVGLSEDIGSYKDQVPPAVSEDADDIINASQTLLEIVGNILDINKIESNKLEIVELVYKPKETIENIAKLDSTRIGDKPIDFKVNIAEDLPYELIGDKVHIKEIVNNLLTNAIKYTEQGEINLNVRCINKGDLSNLIISVQDTGRGIKAEDITKLFTKFERLDVEKNTTTEGTGLGLAITKRLVEMMHGTINVQSQFGKGSMFVVNIPQKIKTLSSSTEESKIQEDVIIDIDNYTNKKILIVDDNALNIKVARRALQDFNFDIEDVSSGQECLDKVNSGIKYDLILMDIMMPNMSGETTFKKLKEINGFNVPVIALTADAVAGAEEHYKGEGFIDYIAKPFKREQIKEKLDLVFDAKAQIDWNKVPVHVIGE